MKRQMNVIRGGSVRVTSANVTTYAVFLFLETALASFLFWTIFPIFRQMIANLGKPQDIQSWQEFSIVLGAVALQCCYWIRYSWLPIYTPFQSVALGHVLLFASRASFFFGGALFSVIFFRHVPELDSLPPAGQALARGACIMGVLFALFCYSLELERLGKAFEERH
jgi:hypothetical protein